MNPGRGPDLPLSELLTCEKTLDFHVFPLKMTSRRGTLNGSPQGAQRAPRKGSKRGPGRDPKRIPKAIQNGPKSGSQKNQGNSRTQLNSSLFQRSSLVLMTLSRPRIALTDFIVVLILSGLKEFLDLRSKNLNSCRILKRKSRESLIGVWRD